MRRAEGDVHYRLKLAALQWLFNKGFKLAAAEFETYCGTVDAFGVNDKRPKKGLRFETAAVEAKATRADFLSDFQAREKVQERTRLVQLELADKETRRDALRDRGTAEYGKNAPNVAVYNGAGSQLYGKLQVLPGFEDWATQYAKAHQDLRDTEKKNSKRMSNRRGYKGYSMTRWPVAHHLYVITPPGLVAEGEAPGWGVLEVEDVGIVRCRRPSPWYDVKDVSEERYTRLIRHLAQRLMYSLYSEIGAVWTEKGLSLLRDALHQGSLWKPGAGGNAVLGAEGVED